MSGGCFWSPCPEPHPPLRVDAYSDVRRTNMGAGRAVSSPAGRAPAQDCERRSRPGSQALSAGEGEPGVRPRRGRLAPPRNGPRPAHGLPRQHPDPSVAAFPLGNPKHPPDAVFGCVSH